MRKTKKSILSKKEKALQSLTITFTTNWLVKPYHNLGLTFSLALIFFSCEEPLEAPSTQLIPDENNIELKYIELPLSVEQTTSAISGSQVISSNNYRNSSNQILSRGIVYCGKNNDVNIGETNLRAYAGLAIESGFNRADSISTASKIVSARLILRLSYMYGDGFDSPKSFEVHQLADPISVNVDDYYYVNDTISKSSLVSLPNSLNVDPEFFNNVEETDSLVIPLTSTFGQDILSAVANEDLSNSELTESLKGIVIQSTSEENAIIGIDIASDKSYIEIAYNDGPAFENDTLQMNFTLHSFTNVAHKSNGIIPENYTQEEFFSLLDNSKVYLNDMLGIYPKIRLDSYIDFIDTLDYLQINNAILEIGDVSNSSSSLSSPMEPPSIIYPYYVSENDFLIEKDGGENFWGIQSNFNSSGGISDQSEATNLLRMGFNSESDVISGDVSFFLQEVFKDPTFWPNSRSILLNGQFVNVNLVPFEENAQFLLGNYNNFLINSDKLKLKIYYTTFED